jgi:hypothetical protein
MVAISMKTKLNVSESCAPDTIQVYSSYTIKKKGRKEKAKEEY